MLEACPATPQSDRETGDLDQAAYRGCDLPRSLLGEQDRLLRHGSSVILLCGGEFLDDATPTRHTDVNVQHDGLKLSPVSLHHLVLCPHHRIVLVGEGMDPRFSQPLLDTLMFFGTALDQVPAHGEEVVVARLFRFRGDQMRGIDTRSL